LSVKGERPQNKNLVPLTERSPEEARAIRSAGGKASQEKRKQKKALAEMLQIISDLPVRDKRVVNRLKRMGITEDDDLTNKMLVADAIFNQCKQGNTYAISLYIELMGEGGAVAKENNLLEALSEATREGVDTSDIPEIQQEASSGNDLVESSTV
jgi:hypothetical protein